MTGAAWMVLFKFADRGIGVVSMLILARLLVPADFGLIALATAMIGILEVLGAFGFDMALIQNRDAARQHYDTAWTFSVLFYASCGALLLLLAYPVARFYHEPRLVAVLATLALGSVLQGFENVGIVTFRKEMQFGRDFQFLFCKRLAGFAVTVALALLWRDYWALVVGIVATKAAGVALSYALQEYRPRFSLAARRELFNFSAWLLINNIIYFTAHRAADFIIGKTSGAHALGVFSVANEIASLPTSELAAPINRAVFPGYAKLSSEVDILREQYLRVFGLLTYCAFAPAVGIALVARPAVEVFLGEKWMEAVPLVQIIAFNAMLMTLQTNMGSLFLARGQPRILTLLAGLHTLLLVPLLLWASLSYGAAGAASALLAASVIMLPVVYAVLIAQLKLTVRQLASRMWRPALSAAVMAVSIHAYQTVLSASLAARLPLLDLAGSVIVGGCVFVAASYALWIVAQCPPGPEAAALRWLRATTSLREG
ncbi:MAG TPA: lipopolysaccharide biosynthesis protein [Burkholderiales bacterium]|nr:lipopolysaccharide biosynthesis protein [Burkholderiales bacterium]